MNIVVIFDMDGVLIDSEPAYMEMNNKLFAELGINLEESNYHELVGMSSVKMWTMLKKNFNLNNEVQELINLEKSRMFEILNSDRVSQPIDGIINLLSLLKEKNFILCVASSSAKKNIELVLKKHNLYKFFDYIVSGEEVEHGKPSPDIFLNAANKFNVPIDKCFVIEDSANGVIAAKSAGMKCIGFKNNGTNQQNLSGADKIIDNFEEENRKILIDFIILN